MKPWADPGAAGVRALGREGPRRSERGRRARPLPDGGFSRDSIDGSFQRRSIPMRSPLKSRPRPASAKPFARPDRYCSSLVMKVETLKSLGDYLGDVIGDINRRSPHHPGSARARHQYRGSWRTCRYVGDVRLHRTAARHDQAAIALYAMEFSHYEPVLRQSRGRGYHRRGGERPRPRRSADAARPPRAVDSATAQGSTRAVAGFPKARPGESFLVKPQLAPCASAPFRH